MVMRNEQKAKSVPVRPPGVTPLVSRRSFMALGAGGALGLLGCAPAEDSPRVATSPATPRLPPAESARTTPTPAPTAVVTPPEPNADALPGELDAWLAASAVLSQRPHVLAVRTWTTPGQAREIERGHVLTRSRAADLSRSFLDQTLVSRRATDPVARLLTEAPFVRSRYAWPHAWATAHGLYGASYGAVLATLHLREDTLWLGYSTATPDTWTLHDASGAELRGVDPRDVASRIAGAFFEASPFAAAPYRARNMALPEWGAWGMREYVVRNPDAITTATVDDAGERQVHTANLAKLAELGAFAGAAAGTSALPPRYGEVAGRVWQTPPASGESWQVRFARALAITTPTYAPTSEALGTLAAPPAPRPLVPQMVRPSPRRYPAPFTFGAS